MKNEVIRRIQELCKERHISLYRLAKLSDLPNTTLTNMVSKNKMPTIPTIEKICNGLDLTLSQFFSSDKIFQNVTDDQRIILELWQELDFEDRKLAEAYMKGLADSRDSEKE